ncbi:MAG: glycoside hydrolase family 2 TIM barrel-domain containing protein [Rikenellaceae bacterium]
MRAFILFIFSLAISISSLAAREVYSLNSGWMFFFTSENSGDNAREVNIPHVWSGTSGSNGNYLRRITAPEEWLSKRVFIKFYGVQREANLFVNGRHCLEHRGGATAFVYEIGDLLEYGSSNKIQLVVNNSPKSDLLPTSLEQDVDGGIYRDVELIITDKTAISPNVYGADGLFITAREVSSTRVAGDIALHLSSRVKERCNLFVRILNSRGEELFKQAVKNIEVSPEPLNIPFVVRDPDLWSPSSPSLYSVEVKLFAPSSKDALTVRTGFRFVSVSAGEALRINGEPTPMRGVRLYHDAPIVGGALEKRDYKQQMEFIRDIGANAIASAHMPHDRFLYDLCDREGIMAWVDFPFSLAPFLSDIAYYPSARFESNGVSQVLEIVHQNYNHPSIVMWGLFSLIKPNGDDYMPFLIELNELAHRFDPTRPTAALSNQNGDMNTVPDIVCWKQNLGWERGLLSDVSIWRDQLHRRWGSFASGVCYGEGGSVEHQSGAHLSRSGAVKMGSERWFPESRQRIFHEEYAAALSEDNRFWGHWIANLFDFRSSRSPIGENVSGLVSFDRRERKDIYYLYRALWREDSPTLHIAGRRGAELADSLVDIHLYCTDSLFPKLYIGGEQIELERYAKAQYRADSVVVRGTEWVVARGGGLCDSVRFRASSPLRVSQR